VDGNIAIESHTDTEVAPTASPYMTISQQITSGQNTASLHLQCKHHT